MSATTLIRSFPVGRYTVEIHYDHDADAPDMNDAIMIVADHRDFAPRNPKGIKPADLHDECRTCGRTEDRCYCDDEDRDIGPCSLADDYWIFPLFAYIHGGVALSLGAFGCPWDSGQIGYVLASRAEWADKDAAEVAARSLVADWDAYCQGQVFGFTVTDGDGDPVDSCWGFVGDEDGAEAEGRSVAEYHEAAARKADHGRELFDPILFGA